MRTDLFTRSVWERPKGPVALDEVDPTVSV